MISRDSLFANAPEKSGTDGTGFSQERHLSFTVFLLSLFHLLGLHLLLFFLVRLNDLCSYVTGVRLDVGM